ncbi:MAG: TonB-dependent receptor, partial [Acidiphilium sp. 37-67-22]
FGHSFLNGPATVPAKLLAIAPNAEYTGPNSIEDTYSRVAATLNDRIDDHTSIQAVLYYDHLRERLINGNGPVDAQCTDGSTTHLCGLGSTNPATLLGGGTVPYFAVPSGSIGYGSLAVNSTNTDGYGATAQLSRKDVLFGLKNHLIAGASFDGGFTTFSATNFDGLLNAARVYAPPPGGGLGYQTDEPGALPSAENIRNAYYGLYASDSLDLTPRLTLTLGGRLNIAQIDLHNTEAASVLAAGQVQNPADLSGHHNYEHFNPSLGFSYRLTPLASLYGSYSQANAAPTPAELTCANPTDPCTLSNFITFDPNLKQTVTDSLEAGIRGALLVGGNGTLTYNLDYYHIRANDDVEFLATNLNNNTNGYFANIGGVLRQGADLALRLDFPKWDAYFNDSLIEATYQSSFRVASHSPSNIGGVITVRPGDHLAGVPENLFKFGADYKATPSWKLGLSANAQTGTYLHGDQSNQQPKLPGFVVLNFTTSYRLTPRITLFGEVDNFTDAHYYVYGGFSNPAGIAYVLGPA